MLLCLILFVIYNLKNERLVPSGDDDDDDDDGDGD
jgi:hypothetical protein